LNTITPEQKTNPGAQIKSTMDHIVCHPGGNTNTPLHPLSNVWWVQTPPLFFWVCNKNFTQMQIKIKIQKSVAYSLVVAIVKQSLHTLIQILIW
jgi:hypothetical protein